VSTPEPQSSSAASTPPPRATEEGAIVLAGGVAILLGAIGAAHGGYFPTAWGWSALAFGVVALVGLATRRRVAWRRQELFPLAALALFVAWVGLSIIWSDDVPGSVLELQRALVYLLAFTAALLVLRRQTTSALIGGVLLAITLICCYALGTRFFPDDGTGLDTILVNRLSTPIGYWNALAILSAMGGLLALGLAARARPVARAAAAACLPILVTALYYTYSRGGWIALIIGALLALALDPRRLQLLTALACLAPWSGLAVLVASQQEGLTQLRASHDVVVEEGGEMALVVLGLAAASCLVAWALAQAELRIYVPARIRRGFSIALAAGVGIALVAVFARFGDPITLGNDAWESFADQNPAPTQASGSAEGDDLNQRLFRLEGEGRVDFWEASWDSAAGARLVGIGPGGFEQYWLRERTEPTQIRDAHGLWQEQVGELGLVGLCLLVAVFALPLLAAFPARRNPLGPATAGAYVAFLAHASVDWDWEVPVVTLSALMCAAALLFMARRSGDYLLRLPGWGRIGAAALVPVLVWFSIVGGIANQASSTAAEALDRGDWNEAEEAAERQVRWAPWSGGGWRQLGLAQAGEGDLVDARASMRKATEKDPSDWRAWYDLGNISTGSARQKAYVEAARRNPLGSDITVLRDLGFELPAPPGKNAEE
jgi:O-Antigen ligase